MAWEEITTAEVAAKEPIDDTLMGKGCKTISMTSTLGFFGRLAIYFWSGKLKYLSIPPKFGGRILTKSLYTDASSIHVKRSGSSGTLADVRYTTKTPIYRHYAHQYTAATSSIGARRVRLLALNL